MTTDQLRTLWKAEPFRPFVIHLADGRQLQVGHPEFLSRSPGGRTIILYQSDESFNIIDLLLVADLEVSSNGMASAGGAGNNGLPVSSPSRLYP
jgi:hypothetical protein